MPETKELMVEIDKGVYDLSIMVSCGSVGEKYEILLKAITEAREQGRVEMRRKTSVVVGGEVMADRKLCLEWENCGTSDWYCIPMEGVQMCCEHSRDERYFAGSRKPFKVDCGDYAVYPSLLDAQLACEEWLRGEIKRMSALLG